MALTLHIGFDFWGAGNLGDDLMLAGFQNWIEEHRPDCRITALCAHDITAMRLRFPRIRWFGADPASRDEALHGADLWVGLGGGVFQIEVGTWILDQMLADMTAARQRGLKTFLVGVGVNNRAALQTGQAHRIHEIATALWLRAHACLAMALACGFAAEKTHLGADTAHLFCAQTPVPRANDATAFVLHASPADLSFDALLQARNSEPGRFSWVCQEYRSIPDSEFLLHSSASPAFRDAFPLGRPDYATASVEDLHAAVSAWGRVLSSRFHTSLAAAWSGARLVIFERNDKLRAIREDLGCERCARLDDAAELTRALHSAQPVASARLQACLWRTDRMMHEFAAAL